MTDEPSAYDHLLREDGPSAFVTVQHLEPAGGCDDIIFPPTFAPPKDKKDAPAGYVVDEIRQSSKNSDGSGATQKVCLLDSVGSQANRLEPLFRTKYQKLVPQVTIKLLDRDVNVLDLGHRIADVVARSSPDLSDSITQAFRDYERGDATALAKLAPTTIVFGAWDSRETQVKLPRLISSTVRAFDVQLFRRAAQYRPALRASEVRDQIGIDTSKKAKRDKASAAGLLDVPSGITHGGIQVWGHIERRTIVNLAALRTLGAPAPNEETKLRRYILGLTLLCALYPIDLDLRQGCLLVLSQDHNPSSHLVYRDGRREPFDVSVPLAEAFAEAAAAKFVVGDPRSAEFSTKMAKERAEKGESEDAGT